MRNRHLSRCYAYNSEHFKTSWQSFVIVWKESVARFVFTQLLSTSDWTWWPGHLRSQREKGSPSQPTAECQAQGSRSTSREIHQLSLCICSLCIFSFLVFAPKNVWLFRFHTKIYTCTSLLLGHFIITFSHQKTITFSHQNMSNIEKTDFGAKMLDFEWCENVTLMAEIWCENDIILVWKRYH